MLAATTKLRVASGSSPPASCCAKNATRQVLGSSTLRVLGRWFLRHNASQSAIRTHIFFAFCFCSRSKSQDNGKGLTEAHSRLAICRRVLVRDLVLWGGPRRKNNTSRGKLSATRSRGAARTSSSAAPGSRFWKGFWRVSKSRVRRHTNRKLGLWPRRARTSSRTRRRCI